MIEACITIHDLNDLGLTPQQLHQLKWTWAKMVSIGGSKDNTKYRKLIDIYTLNKKQLHRLQKKLEILFFKVLGSDSLDCQQASSALVLLALPQS